ncbi:hypothetical protein WKH54_02875 [Priestia megaterium]|uniref:hypothetical protein n=1 Tax=Priestia megaterium TaxID=1404 RepID=UPI00316BC23A
MNQSNRPSEHYSKDEVRGIIINMFYAATGYEPYEELIGLFTYIGIQRTAEVLCCYKQSKHVRNPLAWFRRAIQEGYKPSDIAVKKDKKVARRNTYPSSKPSDIEIYNWLEE